MLFRTGVTEMFNEELKQIIKSVMEQGVSGHALMAALTENLDPKDDR